MFATMEKHAWCLRDDASGLPGAGSFADRVLHARQRGGRHSDPFVVAFMDLARTGTADATRQMQHAEVAQQLAERLQEPLRSDDTVAALGPLQFGFLFEGVPSLVAAYAVLTRALQNVSGQLSFRLASGAPFDPEGRCGAAVATEPLSDDAEVLLRAWTAFERAQLSPSPALAIYDPDRDGAALIQLRGEGARDGQLGATG